MLIECKIRLVTEDRKKAGSTTATFKTSKDGSSVTLARPAQIKVKKLAEYGEIWVSGICLWRFKLPWMLRKNDRLILAKEAIRAEVEHNL